MNLAEAKKRLAACGQEHVLEYWKDLSKAERSALLAQIATIDPKSVKACAAALKGGVAATVDTSRGLAPKVAELKGLSPDEVARITTANARRMFLPDEVA